LKRWKTYQWLQSNNDEWTMIPILSWRQNTHWKEKERGRVLLCVLCPSDCVWKLDWRTSLVTQNRIRIGSVCNRHIGVHNLKGKSEKQRKEKKEKKRKVRKEKRRKKRERKKVKERKEKEKERKENEKEWRKSHKEKKKTKEREEELTRSLLYSMWKLTCV